VFGVTRAATCGASTTRCRRKTAANHSPLTPSEWLLRRRGSSPAAAGHTARHPAGRATGTARRLGQAPRGTMLPVDRNEMPERAEFGSALRSERDIDRSGGAWPPTMSPTGPLSRRRLRPVTVTPSVLGRPPDAAWDGEGRSPLPFPPPLPREHYTPANTMHCWTGCITGHLPRSPSSKIALPESHSMNVSRWDFRGEIEVTLVGGQSARLAVVRGA